MGNININSNSKVKNISGKQNVVLSEEMVKETRYTIREATNEEDDQKN